MGIGRPENLQEKRNVNAFYWIGFLGGHFRLLFDYFSIVFSIN
jgi:hypothetical protein